MLKQLRYFQSVVRTGSFSTAAEENYISQSAISQQIKALEQSLGVTLLKRHNRKSVLTPAGEHFYKKSLIIVSDYDRLTAETVRIARGNDAVLRIGYLKTYGGQKFHAAVAEFSEKHPDVVVELIAGNHEGSGLGASVRDLKKFYPNAVFGEGLAIHGAEAKQSEKTVTDWAKKQI